MYIHKLKIGNIEIENNIILAPMAGITDMPFRFICKKYSNQASFSYIWDFDNLLKEKDSPFDRGKEIFEELYKNRIKVRG